jgi:hypothetical protein
MSPYNLTMSGPRAEMTIRPKFLSIWERGGGVQNDICSYMLIIIIRWMPVRCNEKIKYHDNSCTNVL